MACKYVVSRRTGGFPESEPATIFPEKNKHFWTKTFRQRKKIASFPDKKMSGEAKVVSVLFRFPAQPHIQLVWFSLVSFITFSRLESNCLSDANQKKPPLQHSFNWNACLLVLSHPTGLQIVRLNLFYFCIESSVSSQTEDLPFVEESVFHFFERKKSKFSPVLAPTVSWPFQQNCAMAAIPGNGRSFRFSQSRSLAAALNFAA